MLNEHYYELRVPFTVLQKWKSLGANMDAIMHLHKHGVKHTVIKTKEKKMTDQCFIFFQITCK